MRIKKERNPRLVLHLEALRKKRGLSQAELARRVGMTSSAINDLEHGRADLPSGNNLVALADELCVKAGQLIEILPKSTVKNNSETTIKSLT